jgi:hypothetical protein
MSDDWRLRIGLHEQGYAHRLGEQLSAEELEHDLERSFHDRVVVSVSDGEVFCYTGSREQAQAAEQHIRQIATAEGWEVDITLTRWHPTAEEWQDPDAPLPATPAQEARERAERAAQDREESAEQGYPEFEVRVECRSRGEAAELSERLKGERIANVHRWSYVLVGAADEDSAGELAERLRAEAPAQSTVTVERNRRAVYDDLLWNPYSVLGGLGG